MSDQKEYNSTGLESRNGFAPSLEEIGDARSDTPTPWYPEEPDDGSKLVYWGT